MLTFSHYKKAAILGLIGLGLAACANDKVASYVDPAYRAQAPQDWRVAIVGRDMALNEQEAMIEQARAEFRKRGVDAYNGLQIVPPTRTLTPEETRKAYTDAGAHVLLEIASTDKNVYSEQEPVSYYPGSTHTTVRKDRSLIDGTNVLSERTTVSQHQHPGFVSGGYSTTRSTASYTARLIDMSNGKVVWQSDSQVNRSGKNFERHAKATAQDFVDRLIEDGIILAAN